MNTIRRLILLLSVLGVMLSPPAVLAGDDWPPVNPADLALKAAVVEKDADAEVILWEVKVADEFEQRMPRTVLSHYVKIKIFTERGRESQSRIDIPYLDSWSIKDIAAL